MDETRLRVNNLCVTFAAHAVLHDISLELHAARTLALVGESGSGKSTLARAILRLVRAVRGQVLWRDQDLLQSSRARLRAARRDLQIVFQDPAAALDPRMSVAAAIGEPLQNFETTLHAHERARRIDLMLERVGLSTALRTRYPHELSGGQCQRVGIARAMILNPQVLICDEPVSSLDVSIQGQIVNLLADCQRQAGTSMLFISHNLAVVRQISHRVMVMYRGRTMELAPREALFASPLHPYTRALLAAAPHMSAVQAAAPPAAAASAPDPPVSAAAGPAVDGGAASGCVYRHRCPYAIAVCDAAHPPLLEVAAGHWAACHRAPEFRYPYAP